MNFSEDFEEPFTSKIRSNRGCSFFIPIPKKDALVLKLKEGESVRVALRHINEGKKMSNEKELLERVKELENENIQLKETIEILEDPEIMKRVLKKDKGKTIPLADMKRRLGY